MAVARSLGAHGAWCTLKEADHPHRSLMHGMKMKGKGRRQATPPGEEVKPVNAHPAASGAQRPGVGVADRRPTRPGPGNSQQRRAGPWAGELSGALAGSVSKGCVGSGRVVGSSSTG
eukprot:32613-Chlamydomonas_euryale.AAC.1